MSWFECWIKFPERTIPQKLDPIRSFRISGFVRVVSHVGRYIDIVLNVKFRFYFLIFYLSYRSNKINIFVYFTNVHQNFFSLDKYYGFCKKYLRFSHITVILRHCPAWEITLTKTYKL